jgi:integrase/recombinase XerD
MPDLSGHVQDYLRLRRALGFKLAFEGHVLPQLVLYLTAAGASTVTADLAIAWAGLPQGVKPITLAHRLGAARGFAKYLQTIDPTTQVPPTGIWPARQLRPAPYLWSQTDIARLLAAARELTPPLLAATIETLLGLLAVSGMRVGEARHLTREDVDLRAGVLRIREAKFDRERLVPLHQSTTARLGAYAICRDQARPTPTSTAFFVSSTGAALTYSGILNSFVELTTALGLRTASVQPRMHDLRHSFAVQTLLDWYRAGIDVNGQMMVLSTYLGHVHPAGTYWYLSAAPELMDLAAARLTAHTQVRS